MLSGRGYIDPPLMSKLSGRGISTMTYIPDPLENSREADANVMIGGRGAPVALLIDRADANVMTEPMPTFSINKKTTFKKRLASPRVLGATWTRWKNFMKMRWWPGRAVFFSFFIFSFVFSYMFVFVFTLHFRTYEKQRRLFT